jgi:hypothetical protein
MLLALQQMKITAGFANVASNLLAQCIHGREFDLIAKPIKKMNFNLGLRREVNRMEIQQVGFDSKELSAKRGPIADIGY